MNDLVRDFFRYISKTHPKFVTWITKQRWFLRKTQKIKKIKPEDAWIISQNSNRTLISVPIRLKYQDGEEEIYQCFFSIGRNLREKYVHICNFGPFSIYDASSSEELYKKIVENLYINKKLKTFKGAAVIYNRLFPVKRALILEEFTGEMSNKIFKVNDDQMIKVFMKVDRDITPEFEINFGLTKMLKVGKKIPVPKMLGYAKYGNSILLILYEFIPNECDAWDYFIRSIGVENVSKLSAVAERIGKTVAEVHKALFNAFGAEMAARSYIRDLAYQLIRNVERVSKQAKKISVALPVKQIKNIILQILKSIKDAGKRVRIHGDLHLDQILKSGDDFYVIDFGGEPLRSLKELKQRHTPLRDITGMLRSFNYAIWYTELKGGRKLSTEFKDKLDSALSSAFLNGYLRVIDSRGILPQNKADLSLLLSFFKLEKSIYELEYEMNSRPDWVEIPIHGIKNCVNEMQSVLRNMS